MNETFRKALFPLVIIAALIWLGAQTLTGDSNDEGLRFSDALALVEQNPRGIERVTFHPSTQEVDLRLVSGKTRSTVYPVDESAFRLQQLLEENEVPFDAKRTGSSAWWSILTSLLPFVLLFGFWVFLMRQVRQNRPTEQGSQETRSPR